MAESYKTIVLVGQPNVGKSTVYNALADKKITTSNFAGTTVKVNESLISVYGETCRLVDLPGTYSMTPTDGAEEVTRDYLLNSQADLIVNVADASALSRSLALTLELKELGKPMVLALNMQDEARRRGIEVSCDELSRKLGIKIVPMTALLGKGTKELIDGCYETFRRNGAAKPKPTPMPVGLSSEQIAATRNRMAAAISEESSSVSAAGKSLLSDRIDALLLRPITGYAFLAVFFALYFAVIFYVGSFLSQAAAIPLDAVGGMLAPLKDVSPFLWTTVDAAWQGVAGALGIVLPYFLPLVFLTAIFEESGYLARIAFLVDSLMQKAGLHGKSVVSFILGFACSIPAIYSTRIIEDKRERTITAMLLPFVPCSARISVIFALSAALAGPVWAAVIFVFTMLVIGVIGKLISKRLAHPVGFILEIPSLKSPRLSITFRKTWTKISDFLRGAILWLIIGSVALGWIEYFNVSAYVNGALSPLVNAALGLPDALGSTLLFGFFRKELIIVMTSQAMGVAELTALPMTVAQVVTFLIFVTLYFPCFTTFVVLWKEFGSRVALYSAALSVVVATICAMLFRLGFMFF